MIELILTTLAEFGLIRENYKHQKRISKKEKEDGIKRPIQKYFFQPSVFILIAVIIIVSLSAFLFFTYQRTSVFPKKTEKELTEMNDSMEKWHEKFGHYPTELTELIGNNPIRQDWIKDAWNRPYKYTVSENGKGFSIISAGADGRFGTEDDIK